MWDPRPRITRRRSLHEYSSRKRPPRETKKPEGKKDDPIDPIDSVEDPDVRNSEELRFFELQRYPSDPSGMLMQNRDEDQHDPINDPNVSPIIAASACPANLPLVVPPVTKEISDHLQNDYPSPGSSYCSSSVVASPSLHDLDDESLILKADLSTSTSPLMTALPLPTPPPMSTVAGTSTATKPPRPPLCEVDRFTMCSNRIV